MFHGIFAPLGNNSPFMVAADSPCCTQTKAACAHIYLSIGEAKYCPIKLLPECLHSSIQQIGFLC